MIYFRPMSLFYRNSVKPVLTLFFSLSVLFTGIAINRLTAENFASSPLYLYTGILLMLLHLASYAIINYSPAKFFPLIFTIFGFVIIVSTLTASYIVHQDFLKTCFHSAAQLFIISLYRKKDIYREDPSKNITRCLIILSTAFIFASIVWMLMLGYHIIFKDMPGGHSWMLFNLYSNINILVGIDALIILQNSLYTHVCISRNSIKINDKDFSNLLSSGDIAILAAFAGNVDRKRSCADLLSLDAEHLNEKCVECLQNQYKATMCSDYKRIYNQIHKIKKFLETMDIATIRSPENKREITTEGWNLRMFENIRLHPL